MNITDTIEQLPRYFSSESPNRLEALVASVTGNPVIMEHCTTSQPTLFVKLLKHNKAISSYVVLAEKKEQLTARIPQKTRYREMLLLLNCVILIRVDFDNIDLNNVFLCSGNEDAITKNADYRKTYRKTMGAIRSTLLSCVEKKSDKNGKILLLCHSAYGFYTLSHSLEDTPVELDEYYNDDLLPFDRQLKAALEKENGKGIVFLHGEPGTGKTSYIRHLLAQTRKKAIYIPSNLAPQLSSPEFLEFMSTMKNTIIIIEDAESIISSRNNGRNDAVSNLLNLSDGLLSDCLNLQFICTFNIPLCKVDSAFLRPGRLIGSFEFKSLEQEKASKLVDRHKLAKAVNGPMTLSEIFTLNLNSDTALNGKARRIGFGCQQ